MSFPCAWIAMILEPSLTGTEIEAYRAELAGLRIGIVGAGRSGMACLRLLGRLAAEVTLADVKAMDELLAEAEQTEALDARLVPEFTHLEQLPDLDRMIVSPGVPRDHPAVIEARARQIEVIGELELAYRLCAGPIVAVTGTNGKGTCCRLLSAMLEFGGVPRLLAGNIGLPLADQVGEASPDTVVVVEVSSFQLETIVRFRPRVAVLLNLFPDHLDRHEDLDEYVAAKSRVFENQTAHDFAVVNVDDPIAAGMVGASRARVLGVSTEDDNAAGHLGDDKLVVDLGGGAEEIGSAGDFPLPGRHHATNLLAAAVVARMLGVQAAQIAAAVREYEPPQHHMEHVAEIGGVDFINDSKACNPAAALADLAAIEQPFVTIVGGKDKGAGFSGLGEFLCERARQVVLIGEATDRIAAAMGDAAPEHAESMEAAVARAWQLAQPGDAVILAPGCSSFDMFNDAEHRGEVFCEVVRALAQAKRGSLPADAARRNTRGKGQA